MALGAGYGAPVYERFLGSLRATGYSGDILLAVLASEDQPEIRFICQRHGAHLLPYPVTDVIPICARFFVFSAALSEQAERYSSGMILHADIRDVIFQRDPFSFNFPEGHELFLALEDGLMRDSNFNCNWLREGFGEETMQSLLNKRILCCGTTLGTCQAMLQYFQKMRELIFGKEPLTPPVQALRNDQGVHNYLYYSGKLAELKPLPLDNTSGLFLTLGLMKNPQINAQGQILCADGKLPCVVHQFDRLPSGQLADLTVTLPWPLLDLVEMAIIRETFEKKN